MISYLKHVAIFAKIVEAGSITGAATRLGMAPSGVSEALKTLEVAVGTDLLVRSKRGVELTSQGKAIYPKAREIVAAGEAILNPASDGLSGPVSVSVPEEIAMRWMGLIFDALADQFPDIELIIYAEDELVDPNRFARDLYVRVTRRGGSSDMVVLEQFDEKVVYVGRKDAINANRNQSALLVGPKRQAPVLVKLANGKALQFDSLKYANKITTRIALAESGQGIVGCLRRSVQSAIASGALVDAIPDIEPIGTTVHIASPSERPKKAVREVAKLMAAIWA